MEKKTQNKKQPNPFVRFSGIAIQMGVTIYLGSLLGEWVEGKYPTDSEIYSKGITLLAVFAAMYLVIKRVVSSTK